MTFSVDLIIYVLFFAAMIFSMYAQFKVSSTFNRYSSLPSGSYHTAAEVARMILTSHGVHDVKIERVSGNLTDHYDPRTKTLRLSDAVHSSNSAAAIGVAAHEAGHAVQHAVNYAPIRIREMIIPVTQIGSWLYLPIIMVGFLFSSQRKDHYNQFFPYLLLIYFHILLQNYLTN